MRTLLDTALEELDRQEVAAERGLDERQGDAAVTAGTIAPLAVAGTCELVWVDGPDAASFLQGLLTNDVAALEAGGSCSALILDNKGHIRSAMRVARTGPEAFTLVAAAGDGEPIVALLDEYHFSEDVDIIGPEAFAAVTVAGSLAPAGRRRRPGAPRRDPRHHRRDRGRPHA